MRVLFTTNIPSPYRVDFFNELGRHCELTVLFESNLDKNRDRRWLADKILNFKAIFMKGFKIGDAHGFCPEVLKYMSLKKFDTIVIGAYHTPSGMLAMEYLKLRKIPFILSSDGGMKKEDTGIKYRIKQHFIGSANAWLSTGKLTSEYLEYYGARKEDIHVYPFTSIKEMEILDSPLSYDEKCKVRSKLGIPEGKMILSVGQFVYRKGYDVLLRAAKNLDKSIGIYIVGGIPMDEYLEIKEEMNLTNVHFVDFLNKQELSNYYKAANLFVLPTREDIWGLVINEAMAYGLPIVTTNRCVAGTEMVTSDVGAIINIDDSDALTKEINNILIGTKYTDANKSIQIALNYTVEKMAEVHYQIFNKFNE